MQNIKTFTKEIAGSQYTATFSDLAMQADGSVLLSSAGTVVMVTACMSESGKNNPGYFNLTVEYLEKFYAVGKNIGVQYQKREGRPSQTAILGCRIIDRTIRPLFDQRVKNAVQIIVTVLSLGDADPIVLGINGASIALTVSKIPFRGPVSACRVVRKTGTDSLLIDSYVKNNFIEPQTDVDFTFCGTGAAMNMIEAGCSEVPLSVANSAFDVAVPVLGDWVNWQLEMQKTIGKEKVEFEFLPLMPMLKEFCDLYRKSVESEIFGADSKSRISGLESRFEVLLSEFFETHTDIDSTQRAHAHEYFHEMVDDVLHLAAIDQQKRVDLRGLDEVRPLHAQAGGVSDRLHGSGIFYRGETHVLSIATLSGPDGNLVHEGMEVSGEQRFYHHYNFPPYSTGETGRVGFTGRREIGHGALVEKALSSVIPNVDDFPYSMRVVSECVSSNGSTSQASVCAATLALMDAGVPIKRPVVGISIGLMMDANIPTRYALLTDIQGPEDHHGDMDFKVAGTSEGITAIQMDVKLAGVPVTVLKEALIKAVAAHRVLLTCITSEIATHRSELSPFAPRIALTTIDPEKIGLIIGSSGKTIQKIQKDTETTISIEDDGKVFITGLLDGPERARSIIENMVKVWKVGDLAEGEIVKILEEVGAIAEIAPGVTGMIHISELSKERVSKVSDKVQVGQKVKVVVVSVDPERDRIGLSIKRLS